MGRLDRRTRGRALVRRIRLMVIMLFELSGFVAVKVMTIVE